MRKNWLLIGVGLLIAVLAIGAIACGDDDDGDGDGNGDGNGSVDIFQLVATLLETDGSGATGAADISVNGEGILVQVVMAGLQDGVHAHHIHSGSCDSIGAIVVTLDQIVAGADGNGTQTTANNDAPLSQYETGHSLAVHEAGTDAPGAIVSCGEIEIP